MNYDPPHAPPPPPGPNPGNGASWPPPKKKRRSGSEKRKRQRIIAVRVYDDEGEAIDANAAAADLKAPGFLRMLGTGKQRPNERRPFNPNMAEVRRLLGASGSLGSNTHQLVRGMNNGIAPASAEMDQAGKEIRAFYAALFKAFGL